MLQIPGVGDFDNLVAIRGEGGLLSCVAKSGGRLLYYLKPGLGKARITTVQKTSIPTLDKINI